MSRSRTLIRSLTASLPVAALALVTAVGFLALAPGAAEAQVDTYRVLMKNGTTFRSAERPQVAWFDEGKVLLLSQGGHMIALERDEIEKVESDLEFEGYGTLINRTTILVGQVANDASPEDPNAAMDSGQVPGNLSSVLINQPFFAGTAPQGVGGGGAGGSGGGTGAFSSSSAGGLEAQVLDLPH